MEDGLLANPRRGPCKFKNWKPAKSKGGGKPKTEISGVVSVAEALRFWE